MIAKLKSFAVTRLSLRQFFNMNRRRNIQYKPGLPFASLTYFLKILNRSKKPVSFIQIGAYDGDKNDPIHYFLKSQEWQGVLVEPVPEHFARLKTTYSGLDKLVFENLGIAEVEGNLTFYSLPAEYNEPDWLQQIGSFDRQSIEFNLATLPELFPKIIERPIPAIRLNTLFERNNLSKIDLLVIDAEGYEYKILQQINELPQPPEYILFEWGSMAETELKALNALLAQLRYELFSCGDMILAVYQSN